MARTIYLIDSENVASHWVGHVKFASAQDRLIIFWSRNCKGIPFGALEQFLELYPKEQVDFVECYTGPNSMDFHIVAKLGQLATRAPKTQFVIVSNDTGYDAVINHLNDEGVSVVRLTGCKEAAHASTAGELNPELVKNFQCDTCQQKETPAPKEEGHPITAPQPISWGRFENGMPCEIGPEEKQAIEKYINKFFLANPEASLRKREIIEILSSAVYPSKANAVLIYKQLIALPGVKIAKMAEIYRAMKRELLPAIDKVVCPD